MKQTTRRCWVILVLLFVLCFSCLNYATATQASSTDEDFALFDVDEDELEA